MVDEDEPAAPESSDSEKTTEEGEDSEVVAVEKAVADAEAVAEGAAVAAAEAVAETTTGEVQAEATVDVVEADKKPEENKE